MPTQEFALGDTSNRRVQVFWETGGENITVFIDGRTVGSFPTSEGLGGEREFSLPDSTVLKVQFYGSWAEAWSNGRPLPKLSTISEPEKRVPRQPPGYGGGGGSLLFHPSLANFADKAADATWKGVWRRLFGFVGFVMGVLVLEICVIAAQLSGARLDFGRLFGVLLVTALVLCVVVPLVFFAHWGIVYLSALLFGGRGNYLTHSYTIASFQVPLACLTLALAILLGFLSLPGAIISIPVGIYGFVLLVLALRAVHALSTLKAVLAAILSSGVIAVITYLILPAIVKSLQNTPTG